MPSRALVQTRAWWPFVLLLLVSCHQPPEDPLRAEFETAKPSEWVRVLDPGRGSPGYNLMIFRRRIPMLLDLSGGVVHAWPTSARRAARG